MSDRLADSNFPTFGRIWRSTKAAIRAVFNRKTALRLLTLMAVVFAVHGLLMIVWGHQLEARLAQLRARGEPVNGIDLVRKVPANRNAAVVYGKAFAAVQAAEKDMWRRNTPAGLPDKIYDQTATAAERAALEPEARRMLKLYAPVFPIVSEAVSKPDCVFPVRWQDGAGALFPHFGRLRAICRATSMKAVLDARDGKMDAALDDVTLGLAVTKSVRKEPGSISYLVRIAGTKIVMSGLKEATRGRGLTQSQARRMYDELGRVSFTNGFALAMQGERTFVNWCFDSGRNAAGLDSKTPRLAKAAYFTIVYLWRPISYKDQLVALDRIDRQVQDSRLPYRELVKRFANRQGSEERPLTSVERMRITALMPGVGDVSGTFVRDETVPWYAIMTQILSPVYDKMQASRDSAIAELGMGQVAMALKAYKGEFGAYPASLKELKTKLRWRLPDDPFTGKPFVYKRVGQGFLLYSWGSDLKDDKGEPMKSPGVGDQVWVSEI